MRKFLLAHPELTPDEAQAEFEKSEADRKRKRKAQKERRKKELITPRCPLCNRPYPGKIHPNKIKDFDHFICSDCNASDLPKEEYEMTATTFLGGWKGIVIKIPTQEELAGFERASDLLKGGCYGKHE